MILQALNDYYRRKCDDADPAQRLPPFGLEQKEIPFLLEMGFFVLQNHLLIRNDNFIAFFSKIIRWIFFRKD